MSGEGRPRSILPKFQKIDGQSTQSSSDEPAVVQDTQSNARNRNGPLARSNIRSACLACRQRRSKCTGGLPCARCQTLGTDCNYDQGQDRRTRAIREKGKEELELHKKVLEGIFDAVRHADSPEILQLIRDNASLQTLADAIDQVNAVDEESHGSISDSISHLYRTFSHDGDETTNRHSDISQEQQPLPSELDGDHRDSEASALKPFSTNAERNLQSANHDDRIRMADDRTIVPHLDDLSFRYLMPPLHNIPATGVDQMSQFYLDFRDASKQMISEGVPSHTILGDVQIRCDMLFRSPQPSDQLNVMTWASMLVNSFPKLDVLFRMAWMSLLVKFMRWCVDPTMDTFNTLPESMRPTPLQTSVSHVPHIDLVPIPAIRDALMTNYHDFSSVLQAAGVDIGWTRTLDDAIIHDALTDSTVISPEFDTHISMTTHFTFGRNILQTFPELQDDVRISDEDFIPPNHATEPRFSRSTNSY